MSNFVTENNVPNAKVVASTIAGLLIPLYLALAPVVGLPTFDKTWMLEHIDAILTGVSGAVVALMAIVAYFKKPAPGDGIKPKE